MNKNLALKIILLISIAGMLFSGYLSYGELVRQACPVGGCAILFGIPVYVYGFVMYALVFVTSLLGIMAKK
jgi:uncharacterized membrane protein